MSALEDLTNESVDYLFDKVATAYEARFGKELPLSVKMVSPKEDEKVLGRIHFKVKKGNKVIGNATYKPKRRSVWVAWTGK